MKLKRFLAVLGAVTMLTVNLTACSNDSEKSDSESETITEENAETSEDLSVEDAESDNTSGQTIKWLCYYDINPEDNGNRSIPLTLFEDVYGGKVEWVQTTPETMYDDLSKSVLSGDPADMFPYEQEAVPYGINQKYFQPLDDYIDFEDELWTDMKGLADKLKFNNAYYVVPYSISDPSCLIYSRKMMEDEGLEDPYKLYQEGKWDWETFSTMMDTFVENESGDTNRYGCTGKLGRGFIHSTGQTVVSYDGTKFTNNIMSPEIENAELLFEGIIEKKIHNEWWQKYFPVSGSTLFFGAAPWAIADSNGMNPDKDIFLVPFPKMPGASEYFADFSIGAKMLVEGSQNAEAVAKYIECERIAATDEKYTNAVKEKALEPTVNGAGEKTKFITSEQWDAIQSIISDVTPVVDFSYGLSGKMNVDTHEYETRGIMKNIDDAIIDEYKDAPATWSEIRDSYKDAVDEEIAKYN